MSAKDAALAIVARLASLRSNDRALDDLIDSSTASDLDWLLEMLSPEALEDGLDPGGLCRDLA